MRETGSCVCPGLMNLLTIDAISPELAATLQIDEFYMFYVVGIIVVIEILRTVGVLARDNTAASQIDANPGQSLMNKAARVSPSKGRAGSPARGSPPRGAPPKGKAAGKRMY